MPSSVSATGTSSAATAQTVTQAAPQAGALFVSEISVAIRAASAGADITATLKDGSTAKYTLVIGAAEERGSFRVASFNPPVKMSYATAANLVVSAGGTGCITEANIVSYEDK